jgi:hypothetical protein
MAQVVALNLFGALATVALLISRPARALAGDKYVAQRLER